MNVEALESKIGTKVRNLRNRNGLTQEELADRTELTKGFISQLERGQTAPSVATLADIVECLGTNLSDFFQETSDYQVVYKKEDYFEKLDDDGNSITWLISTAQSKSLEPIMVDIQPGNTLPVDKPHEGEEFGYVIKGKIEVHHGENTYVLNKGDSFIFPANKKHWIRSISKTVSTIIWVSSPPNF